MRAWVRWGKSTQEWRKGKECRETLLKSPKPGLNYSGFHYAKANYEYFHPPNTTSRIFVEYFSLLEVATNYSAHRGMALVAVLWLVASMSLVTFGIITSVRRDMQTIGMQRHLGVAAARADAMILLALQRLHVSTLEPSRVNNEISVSYEGVSNSVTLYPLTALIDINNASASMLADLYQYIGQIDAESARALAQSTVETRTAMNKKGAPVVFGAEEDLFRVPGVTYELYAKIKDSVTADLRSGSGRVNPQFAPVSVLTVLAGGNISKADQLALQRRNDPNFADFSSLNPEYIDMSSSSILRLEVFVNFADSNVLVRQWWVIMRDDPRTSLPWRVFRKNSKLLHDLKVVQ